MAYIVGTDRYQTRMVTTSLDDLISKDNSVRVIDSYVESLNLENLGFIEYSGRNRSAYNRSAYNRSAYNRSAYKRPSGALVPRLSPYIQNNKTDTIFK